LGTDELTLDTATGKTTATRYYAAPGGLTITRTADAAGATTLYYQASDPHGTAGVQMDAANLGVTRRPTDPFGNARGTQPGNGAWAGDKGFVGGTIEGTGFTNLGARQYDPATARFLSVDPLFDNSDPQSWNGYAYANNNPVDGSDPNGTCRVLDDGYCHGAPFIPVNHNSGDDGSGTDTSTSTSATGKAAHDASQEALRQKQAADEALAKAKQAREELISKIVDVVGDLIGFNDARDCFTKGDVMGCINTALNFVPWAKVFKAVKIGIKAFKLWREGEKAYTAIRSAERVAKEAQQAFSVARKTEKEVAEAEQQAAKAAEADAAKTAKEADAAKADSAGTSESSASCPAGNSFPAGTLVQLADGTTKPIDQLEPGDTVLATDPQTGETRAEPVTATITGHNDTEFTQLTLQGTESGDSLTVTSTAHHPYWDETSHQWVDALDVKAGHQLRTADGTLITVTALRTYSTQPSSAHNLTVANLHTYYVLAGATPVLVHNCGGELLDRARELYGTRADEASTVAVARVRSTSNPDKVETWVATERTGLPDEWKGGNAPLRGERYISGQGHAEATIMNRLGSDWEIVGMASSTRMCPTCFAQATGPGVGLTPSPIGKGAGVSRTGNTPWRVVLGGGG
ncbi:polymorphic toxin-type HINT domain-containing protein, partial [Kitasatospora setae]